MASAASITVTRNEVLTVPNQARRLHPGHRPVRGERATRSALLREPFGREPDCGAVSVNCKLEELWGRGEMPG